MQDVHSAKISIPLAVPVGAATVIVAANPSAYIYVHEISGDLASAGSIEIFDGSTSLAKFTLDAGQGLTLQDEPGNPGVPRFIVKPGNALKFTITGGQFDGALDYSLRY